MKGNVRKRFTDEYFGEFFLKVDVSILRAKFLANRTPPPPPIATKTKISGLADWTLMTNEIWGSIFAN